MIILDITQREFQEIVNYVKSNYGINLQQKKGLIVGRLENYLIKNGFNNYDEYLQKVKNDKNGEEAKMLVNYLTTNHTYFMRESLHFNYMHDVILPELVKKEQMKKNICIWSAASSTGEEPYSIVMVLKDFFKSVPGRWDTRILATDISTKVLNKAMEGTYLNEQLDVLPERWRKNYFRTFSPDQKKVTDEIRNEVIFRKLNLMEPFSFKNKFHIVFLRNVMIYFEEETKVKLVNKIYDCMENGGYLFTGMSEVIDKRRTKFKYLQPSIYKKVE